MPQALLPGVGGGSGWLEGTCPTRGLVSAEGVEISGVIDGVAVVGVEKAGAPTFSGVLDD